MGLVISLPLSGGLRMSDKKSHPTNLQGSLGSFALAEGKRSSLQGLCLASEGHLSSLGAAFGILSRVLLGSLAALPSPSLGLGTALAPAILSSLGRPSSIFFSKVSDSPTRASLGSARCALTMPALSRLGGLPGLVQPSAQQHPLRQQGRSRAARSSGLSPTPCGTTSLMCVVRPVRGRMVEPSRLCKEVCRTLLGRRLWQLWPNRSRMLMQDASPIWAQVPWS